MTDLEAHHNFLSYRRATMKQLAYGGPTAKDGR